MTSARQRRRNKVNQKPGKTVALYDAKTAEIGLAIQEKQRATKAAKKTAKPLSKSYPTKKYTPHSYLLTGETLAKEVIGTCGGQVRKCEGVVRHGEDYQIYTERKDGITKVWLYHPGCFAA